MQEDRPRVEASSSGEESGEKARRLVVPARVRASWTRLRLWQKITLVGGISGVLLVVVGLIVYANLLERRSVPGDVVEPLSVGSVATTTAVEAQQTGSTTLPVWARFEGDSISLDLPAWFVGGRPDDPQSAAALEQTMQTHLDDWPGLLVDGPLEEGGIELVMIGNHAGTGELIVVMAGADRIPWGSSLEEYAEEFAAWFAEGEVVADMVEADRVHYRISYQRRDDPEEQMVSRVALVRAGTRVNSVAYTAPAELRAIVDSIFRTSVGTLTMVQADDADTGS